MSELRTEIRTLADAAVLEAGVRAAAARTIQLLPGLLATTNPLDAFARLRFEPIGHHPIQDRALNMVEQLNQTFTCLASLRATAWILTRHPECGPLRLNLGTASGSDIEAIDGSLAAETFAAVTPTNNDKLRRDIRKVAHTTARLCGIGSWRASVRVWQIMSGGREPRGGPAPPEATGGR
jgi:hypothetical protein